MAARPKQAPKVWHPPTYDIDDIRAIQALAQSDNPLYRRALDWIINKAAATYDNGFVADDINGRVGAFVDGRQFVGQQIIKLMKLKPDLFREPNQPEEM